MNPSRLTLPPEVRRFSGLYRFIPPDRFGHLGINPEDVPLGTYPAEDHPPFLPDRFGGNAYGLGLMEQSVLPQCDTGQLECIDLDDPESLARNHRALNNIFKRLGLLIRFSGQGRPFYLIPRRYMAHFLVEVQAKADEIVAFLSRVQAGRLTESLKVGLVAQDHELLLPELQSRMPHLDFKVISTPEELDKAKGPLGAMVLVGDPRDVFFQRAQQMGIQRPADRQHGESFGFYAAGRFYGLLEDHGELLVLDESPLAASKDVIAVKFLNQGEFKRFLLFSHVYRTRRHYQSTEGLTMAVSRFDFEAFLSGFGVYHEVMEGMLDGRSLAQVEPGEIDGLAYQDLPLPRGSASQRLHSWKRWFAPYFQQTRLDTRLPEAQREEWAERYQVEGGFPDTHLVYGGRRRRPEVTLRHIEMAVNRRQLAGCSRELLADYKDSFAYVEKVLDILTQIKDASFGVLPGLELSRLRKPFESARRHPQLKDLMALMSQRKKLGTLKERLNPCGILGSRTPVLPHLEKLALMDLDRGLLEQLYLIVLGHSGLARVTFGKLPKQALRALTNLRRYKNLDEALEVIRLQRLLSVAEAAAASPTGLSTAQIQELFDLCDDAIRVASDPAVDWADVQDDRIRKVGGLQATATRKMLKLLNLFDHLGDWASLEKMGPRRREALAEFQPARLERIDRAIELDRTAREFVRRFHSGSSAARPYFFRTFLKFEFHGTGRLLPRLGPRATFILLWICVHTGHSRLVDFNPLIATDNPQALGRRIRRVRRALLGLPLERLSPAALEDASQRLRQQGELYLWDSGLHLNLDKRTGALTPRFIEASAELAALEQELERTRDQELGSIDGALLSRMDRRVFEVGCFLAAQDLEARGSDHQAAVARLATLERRFEDLVMSQLLDLGRFAGNLETLHGHCPRFLDRLLPDPSDDPQRRRRLAASTKLTALFLRRLEMFQDMQQSHERAIKEFGPTAAGIVGVSPLQFQTLTASLAQITAKHDRMGLLLMLAVLVYQETPLGHAHAEAMLWPLAGRLRLSPADMETLRFFLRYHTFFRKIVMGEACLCGAQPVLDSQDPLLVEALFVLGLVTTAASQEGLMTEDLLDRFLNLLETMRELTLKGRTGCQAMERDMERLGRHELAFQQYQDIQRSGASTISLRHLLENVTLPEDQKAFWIAQGRRALGLGRLLRLKGLYTVTALDLKLLGDHVPAPYIYRIKGLRSVGFTHFERDLFEGKRMWGGLKSLPPEVRDFVLDGLSDTSRPVNLRNFAPVTTRLNYPNQIKLLGLGLVAAERLANGRPQAVTVDFSPLAEVMDRKFELVNRAVDQLDLGALLDDPELVEELSRAREGLKLQFDRRGRLVRLAVADTARIERKVAAIRRIKTVAKLKLLYHEELRKLKLTDYETVDYQARLAAAFRENITRLGQELKDRVRRDLGATDDFARLEEIFEAAYEEALELPLSSEGLERLRDIYDMNVERLRSDILEHFTSGLTRVTDAEQLEELWEKARVRLKADRAYLGGDFLMFVAERFDQKAQNLANPACAVEP